jgi:hypothetical protein
MINFMVDGMVRLETAFKSSLQQVKKALTDENEGR